MDKELKEIKQKLEEYCTKNNCTLEINTIIQRIKTDRTIVAPIIDIKVSYH